MQEWTIHLLAILPLNFTTFSTDCVSQLWYPQECAVLLCNPLSYFECVCVCVYISKDVSICVCVRLLNVTSWGPWHNIHVGKGKIKRWRKETGKGKKGNETVSFFYSLFAGYKYYLVCKKNSHDPLKNLVKVSQTNNICHINNLFSCFQSR